MKLQFEFDPRKSASNKIKHGINFVEAQALWAGNTAEFKSKQPGEHRYLLAGKIGRTFWTAVITYRGGIRRIISVRKSNDNEIALHQKRYPEKKDATDHG